MFNFKKSEGVIEKAIELINSPYLKEEFQNRRERFLSEKIDVTAFTVWFVENYPESVKIINKIPKYQNRFI